MSKPSWRRLFRFSLRGLLLATAIVAVLLAFYVSRYEKQRRIVKAVESVGGWVYWDYEIDRSQTWRGFFPTNATPPGPRWLRRLAGDTCLAQIERVYIQDGAATDRELESLAGASSIRWLVVSSNGKITDEGMQHLSQLDALEILNLSGAAITDNSLEVLENKHNLRRLGLTGTQITDAGLPHLYGLQKLEQLGIGPHVSKEAVEKLRKKLPNCQVGVYR